MLIGRGYVHINLGTGVLLCFIGGVVPVPAMAALAAFIPRHSAIVGLAGAVVFVATAWIYCVLVARSGSVRVQGADIVAISLLGQIRLSADDIVYVATRGMRVSVRTAQGKGFDLWALSGATARALATRIKVHVESLRTESYRKAARP